MALGQKLEEQRALGHCTQCTVHTFLTASTLHTLPIPQLRCWNQHLLNEASVERN